MNSFIIFFSGVYLGNEGVSYTWTPICRGLFYLTRACLEVSPTTSSGGGNDERSDDENDVKDDSEFVNKEVINISKETVVSIYEQKVFGCGNFT